MTHLGPHKYQRFKLKSGTMMYKCMLPRCTHLLYGILVLGRECVCWRCGDTFIINRKSIRNRYLHCEDCTKTKPAIEENAAEKLLDDLNIN